MEKIGILLFTANPDADLRLGEEVRQIEEILESADLSGVFALTTVHETRPDDLSQRLDRHKPHIVQFSAHSEPKHLVLTGPDGKRIEVDHDALANLFRNRRGRVRIVVLNACKTKALGQAICDEVDCVICTNDDPADDACLKFAAKFYRSLGAGNSVQQAFQDAGLLLDLEGFRPLGVSESAKFELLVRHGIDASRVVLVNRGAAVGTQPGRGRTAKPTSSAAATVTTASARLTSPSIDPLVTSGSISPRRLKGKPDPPLNPFTWRGRITLPDGFFDRQRERAAMKSHLSNWQNCQIIGPRRIGKSSLLLQLQREAPAWGEGKVAAAFLDLQDEQCYTVKGWLRSAATQCGWPNPPETLDDFSQRLDDLSDEGRHVVLLLDEFEEWTKRPDEFNTNFFTSLRSLVQKEALTVITASKSGLRDLTRKMRDPVSSAFFNVFPPTKLGLFDDSDASDFVALRRPNIPLFSTEEKTSILAFGRRHPLALQVGCYHVLEGKIWGIDLHAALEEARQPIEELIPEWPKWD